MKQGDRVIVDYSDARGQVTAFEGEFDSAVNDSVVRVRMGGINVLLPIGAVHAVESGNEQVQERQASFGQQERPQGQEPEAGRGHHDVGKTG